MKTTVKEEGGKVLVTLQGRLDTAASEQTAKELAVLHDMQNRDINIDCSGLEYISSSGLRILLSIRKRAAEVGSKITLSSVSEGILEVLKTTGFTSLFEINP